MKTVLALSEHYFNEDQLMKIKEQHARTHNTNGVTKSQIYAMKISIQHVMAVLGPKISLTDHQISIWNLLFDRVFEHLYEWAAGNMDEGDFFHHFLPIVNSGC